MKATIPSISSAVVFAAALLSGAAAVSSCQGNDTPDGDCGCSINLEGGHHEGWNVGEARDEWKVTVIYNGTLSWEDQKKGLDGAYYANSGCNGCNYAEASQADDGDYLKLGFIGGQGNLPKCMSAIANQLAKDWVCNSDD